MVKEIRKSSSKKSVDNVVNGRRWKASDILSWTKSNFRSAKSAKSFPHIFEVIITKLIYINSIVFHFIKVNSKTFSM